MASPVLALADEIPNYQAIGLSPGVGWFLFGAVVCLAMFFLAHVEAWRKLWLRLDDPRPIAAVRIAFGVCALCNVNGLWEYFDYLFMDEGLFPTDVAQHYRARSQFAGFGDGVGPTEPWGFFSFDAFVEWLKGPNWSPLLFNSTPKFFWTYLVIFEVVMVLFIVGFQTKWIKWLAWFLYMGIILRNTLFWEATENVYRVFFFYLLLSRCGEAWSVDNWLRCRRLRKQGRLSEPGKPGGGAGAIVDEGGEQKAYEPIYRAIPGWPRLFMILNVAMIYCATGTLKNGPVWTRGDAFYYAFNLDHFYRLPPQKLSAVFGTTLFRVNTWVTHYWEALFPVVVLGLILRWHHREKFPRLEGWRLWMARVGLGGFVAGFYAIVLYSYPVHFKIPEKGLSVLGLFTIPPDESLRAVQWIVALACPIVAVIVVAGFRALRNRRDTPHDQRGALPWLDLDWVCRWLLGRRVWLLLGLIFHGHLILTMNIGWFSPGLLAIYFAFLNGEELALMLTKIGEGLHRHLKIPMPAHVRAGAWIPPADKTLPAFDRRGRAKPEHPLGRRLRLPWPVLITGLALIVVGVLRRVQTHPDIWAKVGKVVTRAKVDLPPGLLEQTPEINPNWFVAMVLVMALVTMARQMQGWTFNPWFGPVIVLAGWGGSVLAEYGMSNMAWSVAAVGILTFIACRVPVAESDSMPESNDGAPVPRLAYGPMGRTLAMVVALYHLCAVASTQFPAKDSWSTFRKPINPIFGDWLQTTQTTQGWGMFAPNPPRRNVFLRVMVVDQDGEIYDLNTDVYACFMSDATPELCDAVYPLPWIWYSRKGKMNRRIGGSEGGKGSWYQKWHSRYVCRQWELEHGHVPDKVELYKVTYPIPSPEYVAKHGPYDPKTQYNKKGSHKKIHTTHCKTDPLAQNTNEVRRRHGLPEVPEDSIRLWNKHRCRKWEEHLIQEAREAGEDVDLLDPKFDQCPDMPTEVRRAMIDAGLDPDADKPKD